MSYERRLEKENKKFELMLTKLAKAHSAPVLTCQNFEQQHSYCNYVARK